MRGKFDIKFPIVIYVLESHFGDKMKNKNRVIIFGFNVEAWGWTWLRGVEEFYFYPVQIEVTRVTNNIEND